MPLDVGKSLLGSSLSQRGEQFALGELCDSCGKARRKARRKASRKPKSRKDACRKKSNRCCGYKRRRFCCPGTRRYKTHRFCRRQSKITICNRNWARISIHPFINFLRCYRRRISKDCPPTVMQKEGRRVWNKMSRESKAPYIEQAKRARCRGYHT